MFGRCLFYTGKQNVKFALIETFGIRINKHDEVCVFFHAYGFNNGLHYVLDLSIHTSFCPSVRSSFCTSLRKL